MTDAATPIVEMRGICKSFGAVRALHKAFDLDHNQA